MHTIIPRPPLSLLWIFTLAALTGSCGPGEADSAAPANILAEPEVLGFPADVDSEYLSLLNTGGQGVSFSVTAAAESSGVAWLQVKPTSGVVEAGGAKGIEVRVVNRDKLGPGDYQGKVTIEAPGLESITVPVSMNVGQPVLGLDPADVVDFGATASSKTLVISNEGSGSLKYTVTLPGAWLTTEAVLQKEIGANDPQSIPLFLDRELVPWYGEITDEIVVVSNGLAAGVDTGTVRMDVNVFIDPSCQINEDCSKPQHFCDTSEGTGQCILEKNNSSPCGDGDECISGICVAGICCDTECEGQCESCNLDDKPGYCSPVADGVSCDDGLFCTDGDTCLDGSCSAGATRDCASLSTPCGLGYCDEEMAACSVDVPTNKCGIEGKCYEAMEWHSTLNCYRCIPQSSQTEWSLIDGSCFVDGQCYALAEPIGPDCKICNPAEPLTASDAQDGDACLDDNNGCTEDICMDGKCEHLSLTTGGCDDGNLCTDKDQCVEGACQGDLYSCTSQLECTDQACDGLGGCLTTIKEGFCLINNECYQSDEPDPGTSGCSVCKAELHAEAWTTLPDGVSCDDGDLCTTLDHCSSGLCVGSSIDCDDLLSCTADYCAPETGDCAHEQDPDSCIIDGKCIAIDTSPAGKDAQCKVCSPVQNPLGWSPYNEEVPCDDGLECSLASKCFAGECVPDGQLCNDGNECTQDTCAANDVCEHVNVVNGTPCVLDAVECTEDICVEGTCAHPVSSGYCRVQGICVLEGELAPDNPCFACDSETDNSTYLPGNDGGQCDDGQYCTVEDSCSTGVCSGIQRACPDDICKIGLCDEIEDVCKLEAVLDGTACDDAMACTEADSCTEGQCHGMAIDCSALTKGNPCLQAYCVTETGECAAQPTAEGDFCEDGLACSSQTTCQEDGTCSGGNVLTANQCNLLLENTDQCRQGQCIEPGGCKLVDLADGAECAADNASADCQSGICQVLKCDDTFADCNLSAADGCEANLMTAANNCGECEESCSLDNALTGCVEGECVVSGCADGFSDCDGQADTGCEIDVKFDPANCGGCGLTCGGKHPAKITMCEDQECIEIECESGTYDLDNDPANGCEVDNVIWVDGWNLADPDEDGSFAHPFDTITEALAVAQPDDVISIAEGDYDGGFEISTPGLTLHGAKPEWVKIASPDYGTGILVTANNVTLAGLTVTGGRYAVHFQGTKESPLSGGLATNLVLVDALAPWSQSSPSAGVFIEHGTDLSVSDITLDGVQGGSGPGAGCCAKNGGNGGHGYGVWLIDASQCQVENNSLANMQGGMGGMGSDAFGSGGHGGDAIGIRLDNCTDCTLAGNNISSLTGGTGGGGAHQGNGGNTGLVAGILLAGSSSGNQLESNAMATLYVGTPGIKGQYGYTGNLTGQYGVYLEDDSLNNVLAPSNTLESEPVVYLHGADGGVISGYLLEGQLRPTNMGKIAVVNSTGVAVTGNKVGNFKGGNGLSGGGNAGPGGDGWDAMGIYLANCAGCSVTQNTVHNIEGGVGGTSGPGGKSGYGGLGAGIRLANSPDCVANGNVVHDIAGGRGGRGGNQASGRQGGAGFGVYAQTSASALISGSLAYRVDGGEGGTKGNTQYGTTSNGPPGWSAGIYIKGSSGAKVASVTCVHIGVNGSGEGAGFVLGDGETTPVAVIDSIFAHTSGFCIDNFEANSADLIVASYLNLHDCAKGAYDQVTLGVYSDGDPLFVEPGNDNYHLQPESPCIDAGKGSSECLNEPAPNGCRINLGAYGNTPEATPKQGVNHCDECPF